MNMYTKRLSYIIAIAYVCLLFFIANTEVLAQNVKNTEDITDILYIPEINNSINYIKVDLIDKEIKNLKAIQTPDEVLKAIPSDLDKRCPQWEFKFIEFGLPVDVFSYIAWRESNCNEKAINAKYDKAGNVIWTLNKNGSIDRGLVQVNSCWKSVVKDICGTNLDGLINVDCNIKVEKYILQNTKGGLGNWSIKTSK